MSGPLSAADVAADASQAAPTTAGLEVIEGRVAQVGHLTVRRVLPRRPRRTVGAWCFVDHVGPVVVSDAQGGADIGPHPHIGLQTVTWLLEGTLLHRDSLGSEQLIRPGELNLMTAGRGVAHAEESTGVYEGGLQGVQLWVALPDASRESAPAFAHYPDLPRVDVDTGAATVLVGDFMDAVSPARRDTDHVGVDLDLGKGRTTLPLRLDAEYALVVLVGAITIDGVRLEPGRLGYLGVGRDELVLDTDAAARALLLGGSPFAEPEPILMWWNYVARTREEISAAHLSWLSDDDRFGPVASPLQRVVTARPPWDEH